MGKVVEEMTREGSVDGGGNCLLITKPGLPKHFSRNYGQALKKNMSMQINKSIADLDEILTNKRYRPRKCVPGQDRIQSAYSGNYGQKKKKTLAESLQGVGSITNLESRDIVGNYGDGGQSIADDFEN